jgi:hypothetical protein
MLFIPNVRTATDIHSRSSLVFVVLSPLVALVRRFTLNLFQCSYFPTCSD